MFVECLCTVLHSIRAYTHLGKYVGIKETLFTYQNQTLGAE